MGCQQSKDKSQKPASQGNAVQKKPDVVIPQKAPYAVELVQGETYYWCTCGKSKNQPFCDGAHKGSAFKPQAFTYEKPSGTAYLCGCKHNKTESGPFCDGSHKNIDW